METPYLALFAELGAILGSSESRQRRAEKILARIGTVIPYVAAMISAAKAGAVEHVSLANHGYPGDVERHLNSCFVHCDPAYLLLRRSEGTPLRWRDNPFRYLDTYSAQDVFLPAGFDEGVTVCLRNLRGRYTGSLHLSVADRAHPTDEAIRFLTYLRTMLGELTDLGAAPRRAPAVGCSVVLTPSGPRPGADRRPVPDELTRQVRTLATTDTLPSWFWWRSSHGEVRLVTTERVGEEITVNSATAELPNGLSVRELEVLTLVAAGRTNVQIGHRLMISPKTVAKHVEHMLAKLGVASRTEAAVRATRVGLVLLSAAQPTLPH